MIPIKLRITNFLSYRNTVELDFSQIHLACISGNNGAGKSTLIDAITWALFGKARRTDDALIHGIENECEVQFDFNYENDTYRIHRKRARGKTGEIDFFMFIPETGQWMPFSEKNMRETEARIQTILRMDFETFSNASFFLQGKADQFAQQKPSDRKRILSSILNLDIWEEYKDRATEHRKMCEVKINLVDSRMEDIRLELNEEEERKTHLVQAEKDLKIIAGQRKQQETLLQSIRQVENSIKEQQKLINTLTGQINTLQTKQLDDENRLQSRLQEKAGYQNVIDRAEEIRYSFSQLVEVRKRLEESNTIAIKARNLEKQLAEPELEIEKTRTTLELTFKQLTDRGNIIEKLIPEVQNRQNLLDTLKRQISDLEKSMQEKDQLETRKNTLNEQISDLRSENNRLQAEMNEIKDRRDHLTQLHTANCPLCGQDLSEPHRSQVLGDLQSQGTQRGDQFRANQQTIQQFDGELREVLLSLQTLQLQERELAGYQRQADQHELWLEQNRVLIQEWQDQGKQKLEEVQIALQTDRFCLEEREKIKEIRLQLEALGYDPAIHTSLQQEENGLRSAEEENQKLKQAAVLLQQLEREIEDIRQDLELTRRTSSEQMALLSSTQAAAQLLNSQYTDPREAENTLAELTNQANLLQQEVGAARQRVAVLTSLKEKQQELTEEREALALQVSRYKTLEKAFGKDGVPALLIEQALPEIEIEANEILEKLSGGLMRINFLTQRDFKDKTRDDKKETLDIQISDLNGTRDYEMYSGGEAFRINFAIRLAMSKVLAKRAGARLQTLVIDEGFGSQDASGRQRLIEAIRLVQDDFAKVLVITHLEELKDAFPHRIEVEKGQNGSSIRVVA